MGMSVGVLIWRSFRRQCKLKRRCQMIIVIHTIYLINIYLWKSSTEPEAHHRKRKRDFLQNRGEFVPKRTLAVKMAASITVP